MKVWIVRHCDAGFEQVDPRKERDRELTRVGKATAWAVAQELMRRGAEPTVVLASPYVRTMQTADVHGRVLVAHVNIEDSLQPDRPLRRWFVDELLGEDENKRVMLVGHHDNFVPLLEDLGGDARVAPIFKGEARLLDVDRKTGEWSELYRVTPGSLGLPDLDTNETP